jgi:hypothetical protein
MKQDHLHPFVSLTSLRICGSSISSPRNHCIVAHLCGTQVDSNAHWFIPTTTHFVTSTSLHPCSTLFCLYDYPPLSHRHHRAFCGPPICLIDIAAHLWLTHFVTSTSPHPCGTLFRLYNHLHLFISTSTPSSHRHCRAFAVHPFCLSRHRRAFVVIHSIWSLRLHPPSQYFYFLPFRHLSHERECRIIRDRARLP